MPEARARVDRFVFGPPIGFPVQFRVVGPDPMEVRAIAEKVRGVMVQNSKVVEPHLNWNEQVKSIRLEVDQDRARALGLTPQDVAQTLQTLLSGFTVTQYRQGIEHIDVVARAVPAERLELDRLPTLTIATRNGIAVPLSQIGRLNYEALTHSDFPIVQGTVLLAAMFIIVANIVVDIAYAYLDPRVRYS